MKKYLTLISCVALFSAFNAQAAMSYECYGYKDGKPVSALSSHVTVMADSKAEAEVKAIKKYEENGTKVDYVNCR